MSAKKSFKAKPIEFEVEDANGTTQYRLCRMSGKLRNEFTNYLNQFMQVDVVDGEVVAKPKPDAGQQDGYRLLHGLIDRMDPHTDEWSLLSADDLMTLSTEVLDWAISEANEMNGMGDKGAEAAKKLQQIQTESSGTT